MPIPSATRSAPAVSTPGRENVGVVPRRGKRILDRAMSRGMVLVAAALSALGCAYLKPMPELEGGIDLELQRGAAWQTIKVRPPYVIGPTASLKLARGTFTGMSATGDAVRIEVNREGALGRGPGRVDVDFGGGGDEFVIDGVWNDGLVHFRITTESFRGSIRGAHGDCQYVLDEVLRDGVRHGFSICSGMPEETRLGIPMPIQAWLTPPELAVVMLELLSDPPLTSLEARGGL
jgi:hypothetical protein